MRTLIISADNFEDSELRVPYDRLTKEGVEVDIASLARGLIKGKHGYCVEARLSVEEVDPAAYDLLILPGGKAPAALRNETRVLTLIRQFYEADKPIAAICHGPQLLISAGVLKGKTATGYKSVVPELKAAGVNYKDAEVVVDGNLITSRQPSDLPAFMREIARYFSQPQSSRTSAGN